MGALSTHFVSNKTYICCFQENGSNFWVGLIYEAQLFRLYSYDYQNLGQNAHIAPLPCTYSPVQVPQSLKFRPGMLAVNFEIRAMFGGYY